jgi:ribonucleoside-diphosphate reductase beta chain
MADVDAIELVESTPLDGLKEISADAVFEHVEFLGRELPGPIDLYRRWERQHWSPADLDFSVDRAQWQALPPMLHRLFTGTFRGFYAGEVAVVNPLGSMVHAAPSDDDKLFLSTQLADEARHAYFFKLFFREVLGIEDAFAESVAEQPAGNGVRVGSGLTESEVFSAAFGELTRTVEAVRLDPADYGKWVRSVTAYHILIEGLVALTGQRMLLRMLRKNNMLPAYLSGFTAVARDESRHVSYGIWAMREAVRHGHETDILETVDRLLPLCLKIFTIPRGKVTSVEQIPPPVRIDPRENWNFGIDSVSKRLRSIGVRPEYVQAVPERASKHLWGFVEEYEQALGQPHPVRVWEGQAQ